MRLRTDQPVCEALGDRRESTRFQLREEVKYKLLNGKVPMLGSGKTVNIGSGGVLFTTEQPLPVGRMVEVAVNWPALLDGTCALKFVATGPVLRADQTSAAIHIDRYEFRTRSTRAN